MTANDSPGLKLIALDSEDLEVFSAHLQDAVINVTEMTFLKAERRTGLRFENVLGAQLANIDLTDKRQMLNVLAIRFEPTAAPEGHVLISCAGGAAIRLHVECLEAELMDLGAAWATKSKPDHPDDETS